MVSILLNMQSRSREATDTHRWRGVAASISTYINTKMSVCLSIYRYTFFSAIAKPIGKPFGT